VIRALLGIVFAVAMVCTCLHGDLAASADWGIALALVVCSLVEHP
jgi:hypothetical protein